jgi:hypothetical protein
MNCKHVNDQYAAKYNNYTDKPNVTITIRTCICKVIGSNFGRTPAILAAVRDCPPDTYRYVTLLLHRHLFLKTKKKTKLRGLYSASKLYRPSDCRLSAKLVPTFADRGCHVVSVTDSYGRILGFLIFYNSLFTIHPIIRRFKLKDK